MAEATKTLTRWGKPNAKSKDGKNKKLQPHSSIWIKKIQPHSKWVDRKEKCPAAIFLQLHGWEKQKIRNALRAHEEASTKAQLKSQTEMIAALTA